jgi:hypothetical protein
MDQTNRDLLTKVIEDNLNRALNSELKPEERKAAFDQAMAAIDRENNIVKNDDSYREHMESIDTEKQKIEIERLKMNFENEYRIKEEEFKREEAKKAWMWRGIEIGVVYGASTILNMILKRGFARDCMRWEETQTFTSTPGRSIKDFFRFKD